MPVRFSVHCVMQSKKIKSNNCDFNSIFVRSNWSVTFNITFNIGILWKRTKIRAKILFFVTLIKASFICIHWLDIDSLRYSKTAHAMTLLSFLPLLCALICFVYTFISDWKLLLKTHFVCTQYAGSCRWRKFDLHFLRFIACPGLNEMDLNYYKGKITTKTFGAIEVHRI